MKKFTTMLFALLIYSTSFALHLSAIDGDWNNPLTWNLQTVPSSSDIVRVLHNVTVTTAANASQIQIYGGTLTVTATGILNTGKITAYAPLIIEDAGRVVQTTYTGTNTGTLYTFKRTASSNALEYNLFSSPVANAALSTSGTNPCDLFAFQGNTQEFAYPYTNGYSTNCMGNPVIFTTGQTTPLLTGADNNFQTGIGYYLAGAGNISITGNLKNGTITTPIYSTVNSGNTAFWAGESWNLVGNPYPCAIDALTLLNSNPALTDAVYFWDNGTTPYSSTGDYASFNGTGSVPANGISSSGVAPTGEIAAGQGFYVVAAPTSGSAPTTETLTFTNSMKVATDAYFYKTEQTEAGSSSELYWCSAELSSGQKSTVLVGHVIGAYGTSNDAPERFFDARNPSEDLDLNLSTVGVVDGLDYSIQGISTINYGVAIDLDLTISTAGTIDFNLPATEGNNVKEAYIRDLQDMSETLISYSNTASYYVTPEDRSRFQLVFKNDVPPSIAAPSISATSVGEIDVVNTFEVVVSENRITLISSKQINEAKLYNVSGQIVQTTRTGFFDSSILPAGIYVIQANGEAQKVAIQ